MARCGARHSLGERSEASLGADEVYSSSSIRTWLKPWIGLEQRLVTRRKHSPYQEDGQDWCPHLYNQLSLYSVNQGRTPYSVPSWVSILIFLTLIHCGLFRTSVTFLYLLCLFLQDLRVIFKANSIFWSQTSLEWTAGTTRTSNENTYCLPPAQHPMMENPKTLRMPSAPNLFSAEFSK